MATPNLALQQIIKGISAKSNIGRVDISWGSLNEAKKKKGRVREAAPAPAAPDEEPVDPNAPPAPDVNAPAPAPTSPAPATPAPEADPMAGLPDLGGDAPAPDAQLPDAPPEGDEPPAVDAEPEATEDDVDAEKEKGEKVNAELEKAKAETDQAKKELENNAYVKLNTPTGISYLLKKIVDRAVKTNTLDSLASDFTQKLKISEPDDFKTFSDDMIPYKNIPGIAEFLSKVQSLATSKPSETED